MYSENEKLFSNISKLEIQSRPEIIKPEKIVERDHVDALKDKASVLFLSDVLLIINGNEHTRITIMPIPQRINASWIKGIIDNRIDSIIIILVRGTVIEDKTKKGFNLLPLIYIPNGNAKVSAPTNRNELKEAISISFDNVQEPEGSWHFHYQGN